MASSADKEEIASTDKEPQAENPPEIVAVDLPAPAGWKKKVSFPPFPWNCLWLLSHRLILLNQNFKLELGFIEF